ncbi:MAG: cyclodeaminase/cyclohydrolase family protein [Planctomycetota bacterium]
MGYQTESVWKYVSDAASDNPTPGGGSVSALAGSLAAAMSEMAANFTAGKDKYADVEEEISRALSELKRARQKLLALMEADIEAYRGVDEAMKMPRETEEQAQERSEKLEEALQEAARVPLNIMRQCRKAAALTEQLSRIANPNLITDVGVAAELCGAASRAARLNVEVNLKYMDDVEVREELQSEMELLDEETEESCRNATEEVRERFEQ